MKYGFVYIWYDRKHKRFYIGCHWGTEDDGYICSSRWMRISYRRRPEDFKRRILSIVNSNKQELYEEEYKWLQYIKDEELGKRYYNFNKNKFITWKDSNSRGERISVTHKAKGIKPNEKCIEARLKKLTGKSISDEHKRKVSEAMKGRVITWGDKIGRKGRKCVSEGSIWINNGVNCKRVRIEELNYYFDNGWFKGRFKKE